MDFANGYRFGMPFFLPIAYYDTRMQLLTYQAGYRSPAGTGCGCAVGRWTPRDTA